MDVIDCKCGEGRITLEEPGGSVAYENAGVFFLMTYDQSQDSMLTSMNAGDGRFMKAFLELTVEAMRATLVKNGCEDVVARAAILGTVLSTLGSDEMERKSEPMMWRDGHLRSEGVTAIADELGVELPDA